jgi:hypothetical protein
MAKKKASKAKASDSKEYRLKKLLGRAKEAVLLEDSEFSRAWKTINADVLAYAKEGVKGADKAVEEMASICPTLHSAQEKIAELREKGK